MTHTQRTYAGIALVFALSVVMVLWLPSGELIQTIAGANVKSGVWHAVGEC